MTVSVSLYELNCGMGRRCKHRLLSSFSTNDLDASAAIYVRKNQQWFSLLMLNMLLHLADVYLLQFDHASAEEVWRKRENS